MSDELFLAAEERETLRRLWVVAPIYYATEIRLLAERDALAADLAAARATVARLNRRCQAAEAIASAKVTEASTAGRSFGRALANYAAVTAMRERDEARAEVERLRDLALEMQAYVPDYFVKKWDLTVERINKAGEEG